ncbi:hypothetical protein [uncultured Methylobacterium sp.]|jgi:hypothetical protein|nr:hypothetical protein [uncultured Methylobacterium sp.]
MDLLQLYCLVALPVAALGLYGLARSVRPARGAAADPRRSRGIR